MQEARTVQQESAEDIFFGQVVMIWARWFVIAAGVAVTLWVTTEATPLALSIIPVVALVAVNFYLHGRYMTERPANPLLITVVGLIDIAIITVAVLVWPTGKGFFSSYFVLYYPVVLAFALVMPRKITVVFTVVAIAGYLGAVGISEVMYNAGDRAPAIHAKVRAPFARVAPPVADVQGSDETVPQTVAESLAAAKAATVKAFDQRTKPDDVRDARAEAARALSEIGGAYVSASPGGKKAIAEEVGRVGDEAAAKAIGTVSLAAGSISFFKVMLMRLITLGAVGALGTYYWRIQRRRREEAASGAPSLRVEPAMEARGMDSPSELGEGDAHGVPIASVTAQRNDPVVS